MQETRTVMILAVEEVRIHDSLYYQIKFQAENTSQIEAARINPEAFYPNPKAGDRVSLTTLLGNIMSAEPIGSDE